MKHTPGPWEDSPNASDAIISKNPDAMADAGMEVKYYGGAVVAESITPRNKPLLKAAPDLLDGLVRAEQTIRNLARCGALSGDYVEIAENEAANLRRDIAKARGGREEAT